jgi:hypothetical protein
MVIKSLQHRLTLLLLLPVTMLLFFTGLFGFVYARGKILDQWQEAAILKLERAAHHIDMRLSKPVELITMFHGTGGDGNGYAIQEWLLDRLRDLQGVTRVDLKWVGSKPEQITNPDHGFHLHKKGMMQFHQARISEFTPPRYDAQTGKETVTLISNLKDESDQIKGTLEVSLSFDYLMKGIRELGWLQSHKVCLVDEKGGYLAHAAAIMKGRNQLGETNDPLELAVFTAMKEKPFGTILGSGHPPDQVGGFYKIDNAPWTIILIAPGEEILAPMVRFRFYYAVAGGFIILLIILLIRFVVGRGCRKSGKRRLRRSFTHHQPRRNRTVDSKF